jgi:hypothetical protein
MARTALTVQDIDNDGLHATYTSGDATNDHEFANARGDVFLHVLNGGASPCVVDIITTFEREGLALEDAGGSVPAGEDWFFGPFDPGLYNQSTGLVYVDLDQDSSVTLAAIRLPRF